MQDFVASGRVVGFILVFVVLEAVVLLAFRGITGRGPSFPGVVFMLLPGVCLLLALRAALVGGAAGAVLAWLSAALLAHLLDLWQRQRHS